MPCRDASHVEQYIFGGRRYAAFLGSVGAMPHDDASVLVRVWFDPRTPEKTLHRTTQVATPVAPFLARAKKPFKSYREALFHAL